MPDKVEMSATEYLKAFRQGVKASMEGLVTDKDIESLQKAEVEEKEKLAQEYVKTATPAQEYEEETDYFLEESSSESSPVQNMGVDDLRHIIIQKCSDLGGRANQALMDTIAKYEPNHNPNRMNKLIDLKNLLKDIETLEKAN